MTPLDLFRTDDVESWRQMLRWLRSLFGQRTAIECEARTLAVGPGDVSSFEGVFADVGAGYAVCYQNEITRTMRGAGDEKAAILGVRILTIDQPLLMPVVSTTDATRAM
jgi:hypothetical protein